MTVDTSIGKITADKPTLNTLSLIFDEAGYNYAERGRTALAQESHVVSCEIYNALLKVGFYDNSK